MRWAPGDVVVRREVWQGRPWLANPMYVVEDTDDVLALYVPEGSPFGFGAGTDWPTATGLHPYDGREAWVGEGSLGLHRPGDQYAVWHSWRRPERSFVCWYVNIQAPFRRTPIGIDSLDLELDLLVFPNGNVVVKDEEHVDESAALGRFSVDAAAAIHALGADLAARFGAGERWWDDRWTGWVPDRDLLVPPVLLAGWELEPAAERRDLRLR